MTDTELKEFGEAVKRLEDAYPDNWTVLEAHTRKPQNRSAFTASVYVSDCHRFAYGDTPSAAIESLIKQVGTGEQMKQAAIAVLREKIKFTANQLAQLEAQSV